MHVSSPILAIYSTATIDGVGAAVWACFPRHQAVCSTTFRCADCTDTTLAQPGSKPAAQSTVLHLAFKVEQLAVWLESTCAQQIE